MKPAKCEERRTLAYGSYFSAGRFAICNLQFVRLPRKLVGFFYVFRSNYCAKNTRNDTRSGRKYSKECNSRACIYTIKIQHCEMKRKLALFIQQSSRRFRHSRSPARECTQISVNFLLKLFTLRWDKMEQSRTRWQWRVNVTQICITILQLVIQNYPKIIPKHRCVENMQITAYGFLVMICII